MPHEFVTNDWSLVAPGDHIVVQNEWVMVMAVESIADWQTYVTVWSPKGGERTIPLDQERCVRIRSLSNSSHLERDEEPAPRTEDAARPLPKGKWFRVLGFPCIPGDISLAEERYKALVKVYHPDRGGDHESMARLNDAIQTARRHFALDTNQYQE